jgi:alkanesulfonate monooxygenase SsuD/methylene tetrahydromethanopterin reductase-like flavin-dependent oxidoreductase (luciferase family)
LLAGDVVTFEGRHLRTKEAFLLAPRPVQSKLPLLVGGYGVGLLRAAARYADIVSLTGLGRTLDDGHRHVADWSPDAIDERVDVIRQAVPDPGSVVFDALVQHVEITNDSADAAERVASQAPGLTPEDVRSAPYALIGSVDEIIGQLLEHRDRWGFTSYVVREAGVDPVATVIARLAQ